MFVIGKKVGSGTEQIIYEHLLYVVKVETPERVLERFRSLFIDGIGYTDGRIWSTLESLAMDKSAEECFPLIINRCCYILINQWQMQPSGQEPIAKLIDLLEHPQDVRMTYSKLIRRFRQLLKCYLNGEDYLKLKRLNVVLTATTSVKAAIDDRPLGKLITRYPYLYEHIKAVPGNLSQILHFIKANAIIATPNCNYYNFRQKIGFYSSRQRTVDS